MQTTFTKAVDNILSSYARLTDSELAQGLEWYDKAYDVAKSLGTPVITAGVIAALSPRVTWEENIKAATTIVKAASQGSYIIPRVAGVSNNVLKAWRIANEEYAVSPYELFESNRTFKTGRFYLNILGNTDVVTVDTWAQRVAYPESQIDNVRGNWYLLLERAYQEASKVLGNVSARDLQASTWIGVRGKEN